MSRLTLAAVLLLSTGCGILEPARTYVNLRAFAPPTQYAVWYADVEACLGERGSFSDVDWMVVDELYRDQTQIAAVTRFPDEIVISEEWLDAPVVVRHEMAHHIQQKGDELHLESGRVLCDDG